MSMQLAELPKESPAEPQTAARTPPVHVRRKWIPISTAAWVVGGGVGAVFGGVVVVFLNYFGVRGFLSDLANALSEAVSFALAGFAVALCQWLTFRRTLQRARGWLLVSALGWMLAALLASLAYELFLYSTRLTSRDPDALRTNAWVALLGSIVLAAIMIGALQWLALRRGFHPAGGWIPASAVAWSLGIGLTLLASVSVSLAEGCFAGMLVFPVAGGLVAAAISGEAFARLARHTVSPDILESDSGRRPSLVLAVVWAGLLLGTLWSIWSLRAPYAAMAQQKLPEGCPPSCASTSLSGLNLRGAYLGDC